MQHRKVAGSVPPYRPAQLLDDLARPEAYPAPRPTTVNLATTHISWVFITDHEVWKLKRPIDYEEVR
jgi:aminoglycoside phosphotransferase family enzyme